MTMYPKYTRLGQRLQERTAPLAPDDANNEYAHGHLSEAMMRPGQQLAELVDPPDPYIPWQPLFDVNLCPDWALPWLGQLVGVRRIVGLSSDQLRDAIRSLAFLRRGTPDAIIAAAKLTLTGTQNVWLRERDDGLPYRLEVVTLDRETPDPAALLRAILSQKPAGIQLAPRTTVGWDYQQMKTDYLGKKYKDLKTKYPLYRDLTGGPLP
jgi:hypothetical protein